MAAAIKQPHTLNGLKCGNRLANGRLSTPQVTSGGRETACIRNGYKDPQLIQAEISDHDPSHKQMDSIIFTSLLHRDRIG